MRALMLQAYLAVGSAHAQAHPTEPIRFIVPCAPRGGADIIVRAGAQQLTQRLGRG